MEKYNTDGNDADSLITSYLSGNASEDEISELKLWVIQSENNKQYFRSFCDTWQLSGGLHSSAVKAGSPEWIKLNNQIKLPTLIDADYSGKSSIPDILKYAAGVIIILAVGFLAGKITSNHNIAADNSEHIAVVYAPMGSKAISLLPDGTQVWLNAGSKIQYNTKSYNTSQREVSLSGEAYFKVKTNPSKPFVVNAKGVNVKALGTEFNVKAYPEEDQVVTTLVKGIVKIEGKDKNKRDFVLELKPKQIVSLPAPVASGVNAVKNTEETVAESPVRTTSAIQKKIGITESPVIVDNVNTNKYTSWKDNQWVLEGEEIGNLVVMLERRFNVKINVESAELKKYKFTGTFRNETLEQVLSVLKIATPMRYTIGKGIVVLRIDPVLKDRYQKFITE